MKSICMAAGLALGFASPSWAGALGGPLLACNGPVSVSVDTPSFSIAAKGGLAQASATQVMVVRTLDELCRANTIDPARARVEARRVQLQWGGGATEAVAYFAEGKPGTLVVQYLWEPGAPLMRKDLTAALICAFKPKAKVCDGRGD
ncbi:MAG: hypothetical protein ABIO39_03355 [Caulobacteraceae bacterium]